MPVPNPISARVAGAALAAALASLVPVDGGAAVYKCAGNGDVPVYQETPCPPGKALRDFQTDPPDITVLPGPAGPAKAQKPAARPPPEAKAPKEARPARAGGDATDRKHLKTGMTAGEVRARVGAPETTTGVKGGKAEHWTWLPAPGDPDTVTTITLSNGVVTEIDRRVVKK
ncbi:MAG: hypothetical protein ABI886_06150 [Betaproteobacteria bacterium]